MLQISCPTSDSTDQQHTSLMPILASWNAQCELLETGFNRFWSHFAEPAMSCPEDAALDAAAAVSAMRALASSLQCLLDCVLPYQCPPTAAGAAGTREGDDTRQQLPAEMLRGVRLLLFAPSRLLGQSSDQPSQQILVDKTRRNFSTYVARYLDLTFAENEDESSSLLEAEEEVRSIAQHCGRLLDRLQLRRRLLLDHGAAFIRRGLSAYVAKECSHSFSESHLDRVLQLHGHLEQRWTEEFQRNRNPPPPPSRVGVLGQSANLLPYRVFGEARIRELFSMTIDYPDSECGLKDLAACIEKVPDLRPKMVRTLRSDVEQRLLHPGVATLDILSAYIGAVRSLRILDPSGVSQELALGSVAEYLRRREDTIRAIISKMIGDESGAGGSDDLAAELTRSGPLAGLGENSAESVDDPGQDFDAWRPDPVEAYSSCGSLSRQPPDLLSLLVGIYGSKRLFIHEYQSMLASRLLDNLSFKIDREIKNVELLKLRFGEIDLIKCEVMLKDIEDSRRLCTLIGSGGNSGEVGSDRQQQSQHHVTEAFQVSALILSLQFWPAFAPRRMSALPAQLAAAGERFAARYKAQKCNRGLEWRPQLGRVTVRIELAGRELELTCKPAQYAILTAFLEHRELSLTELAEAAQMQPSYARRNIGFWLQQGILSEPRPERFRLVDSTHSAAEAAPTADSSMSETAAEEEVEADGDAGAGDGSEETWECLWNYVVGMLTNMDSCMSVERIRTMLQLFLVDPNVELDQQKLKNFLDEKVRDGRLTMQGSMYKLA
ncbi:hypothetical protein BOX15_Mlig031668g1 [Macrostomum lignano]|uniref:Anaphase-promoting complex subunit 2 n=2 Tax=Macrostomum lignano TaxID=282301 RepID=A0A1I8GFM2_9PLAT|nr:hypothetical protein BOX15_Mlig031668g1 [Macrostomum lignano]